MPRGTPTLVETLEIQRGNNSTPALPANMIQVKMPSLRVHLSRNLVSLERVWKYYKKLQSREPSQPSNKGEVEDEDEGEEEEGASELMIKPKY